MHNGSLLWETLTGREHLLFYGRLKNLKGSDLTEVSLHICRLYSILKNLKAPISFCFFSKMYHYSTNISLNKYELWSFFCMQAVEESLKSVNLYHGGVADKQARTYSGGMKRRLSVAISLIGDPKVSLIIFIYLYFSSFWQILNLSLNCVISYNNAVFILIFV